MSMFDIHKKPSTYEELEKALQYHTLNTTKGPEPEEDAGFFNRVFIVECKGTTITIEWWPNVSRLYIQGVDGQVIFERVVLQNTFPNANAKMNLQFYYKGDVVFVWRIEKYHEE